VSRTAPPAFDPQPRTFPERLFVPVPWRRAGWLRDRLRQRGLNTTACFDPEERTAGLEFWPGTDPDAVLLALRELGG
jgi:hypothetical protein